MVVDSAPVPRTAAAGTAAMVPRSLAVVLEGGALRGGHSAGVPARRDGHPGHARWGDDDGFGRAGSGEGAEVSRRLVTWWREHATRGFVLEVTTMAIILIVAILLRSGW